MVGGSGEPIRTVDGVTLYREHRPDAFDYPAVSLRLRSNRDEQASIQLTKTLPPALATGQVGFHPEYDQEGWTVEDRTIRYETVVPPNGEVTTLYALQTDAPNPFERVESPPDLDVEWFDDGRPTGDSDVDADRTAGTDRGDDPTGTEPSRQDSPESTTSIGWFEDEADRDQSNGGGDDQPTGTDGPWTSEDAATDTESSDAVESEASPVTDGEGDVDTEARQQSTNRPESALEEAVERIESGDLRPAQRRRLVDAIAAETETDTDGELASRIERLRRRMRRRRNLQVVSEVVHDRRGPLDQVLDDLENRIDGLESSTTFLGENLALTAEHAQQIDDRFDERFGDVTDQVAEVEDDLGVLDDRVDDVADELRDLHERVETLERTIASLGDIVDRVETLEARTESLEAQTETVEANADAIVALRADLEDVQASTEQDDGGDASEPASDGWMNAASQTDGRTNSETGTQGDDP